ncbi:monovalent cation/H+ antiporter complex subunit F [Microtetraspora malaysiensis]|uniref:Monovalent cation/H+ antiporter complex subunit F n=1 Tax=Microtetraspora malaysiensis TaxID=161358 RepID=A0ABW6SMX1_9ACTN|nr:monovalent cation/H+ antiporter complex subunit F [Microtetraspora malaysiensis]
MSVWAVATIALAAGGLGPALYVSARGDGLDRLIGLELGGVVATLVLMLLSHGPARSSYLIAPLVLAVLSFAGTLVFTRVLADRP